MPTREVPRHAWSDFFDRFSRQHQGWLVSLDVTGLDSRRQVRAYEVPLVGITAELQADRGDRIEVALGTSGGKHVTHIIRAATQVQLHETEEGAHEGVDIASATGGTTRLRFRSAMLPERVDDL
jgi:Family of unknown function (DUF5335)